MRAYLIRAYHEGVIHAKSPHPWLGKNILRVDMAEVLKQRVERRVPVIPAVISLLYKLAAHKISQPGWHPSTEKSQK